MSFKNLTLLLLVAGLFVNSFAILLVVDEDGLGMDFATIGDALETAEKGDTIIITKKHTGDWHEDITIDKGLTIITQDLTIKNYGAITIDTEDTVIIDSLTNIGNLSYTDGTGGGTLLISDLVLTGSISYTAKGANGLMQIANSHLSSSIGTGTATTGGNIVRVLSSISSNITAAANYSLELYNSVASHVSYADGDIIGNNLNSIKIINGGIDNETKIVGNLIRSTNSSQNSISVLQLDKDLMILNNKFTANSTSAAQAVYSIDNGQQNTSSSYSYNKTYKVYFYDGSSTTLVSTRTKSVSPRGWIYDTTYTYATGNGSKIISASAGTYTGVATIEHNLFNNRVSGGYGVYTTLGTSGKVLFNHNAFVNSGGDGTYTYQIYSTGGFVTANYNFADQNHSSFYKMAGITDQKGNNKNDTVYTDKGNPDPFYNDIDGTRADVGYEGGAYPYSTFTRAGRIADATLRKPLVMWIEAPRKIRPGQKIEIKATGIAF